eukprot:TRINITY_DN9890_c0_g1_i22.p1 TRINITY_DN9890_c0_g1~~TRINITY_DN9890_c0_g1_i22.p1  ORF type:complete len:264 (+),score=66.76 TRINITY_DN9890_c0_g1_i22:81-794(+)
MEAAQDNPEQTEEVPAPQPLPESVPFDVSKFPCSTSHPELLKQIQDIIISEETPIKERVEGLSEEAHALYAKGVELQGKLQESIDNPNWKAAENEDNFKGYFMKGDDIFLHAKGVTTVDATPIEVYAFLQLSSYRKEYDTTYLADKDVELFPANFKLAHRRYKGKLFVADRDFVLLQHVVYRADGSVCVAARSVEDARVPPAKDPVRANCLVRVWWMSRLPECCLDLWRRIGLKSRT